MPHLEFIPNQAGEAEGLSDAGIETYRDDPFPAIARETSQNSRDAFDAVRCSGQPVRIVFTRSDVPASELPDLDSYRRVTTLCLDAAVARGDVKEIEFFRQASAVLSGSSIPVLCIADYNTKGLQGPCEEGRPFHSLVKSSGVSSKDSDTAGGSFGIGKSAVYSGSDLQTVFYATVYPDGSERLRFLAQGKTKYRSFVDGTKAYRSVGYWGGDQFTPVDDDGQVPGWLRRREIGTSVYSVGVRDTEHWQRQILASLLINFFSAIHANAMTFEVDGELLDSTTIDIHFSDSLVEAAAGAKKEDFELSRALYRALRDSSSTEVKSITIPGAGSFAIRAVVKDGLPKRVAIIRNGMYICDNLAHFGDRFSRFPMYKDFAAIIEPTDEQASIWLRSMENPRHDEFSFERLVEPTKRQHAKQAGTQLARECREFLKRVAQNPVKSETVLDELSEFFASEEAVRPDPTGMRNLASPVRVTPQQATKRTRSSKASTSDEQGGTVGGASNGTGSGGKGGGRGPGHGSGDGGKGDKSETRPLRLLDIRTLVADPEGFVRVVYFTPADDGAAEIQFESSGMSTPELLETVPARIVVECQRDVRQRLEVRFASAYAGPVELTSRSQTGSAA